MIETNIQQPPRSKTFLTIGILAFVIVAAFSVYFQITAQRAKTEVQKLEARKAELDKPLSGSAVSRLNDLTAAVAIKGELQKIESAQLKWSKLMEKIDATIPKLKETQEPLITFRSYNGDANGTISVNASTRSGALDPFADTAMLIRAFAADPSFKDVFVPTITKSIGSDGNSVLNFTLSFSYLKPTF